MGKLAFIFPGQGAQFVGMGKNFCANSIADKNFFDAPDCSTGKM